MAKLLFTTLPTNDLGLLARSLPIARELAGRGHEVVFSSPAPAPARLIAEAGLRNASPRHALLDLARTGLGARRLARFLLARGYRERHHSLFGFLRELVPALPWRSAGRSDVTWNMDHAAARMGMLNEGFVRAMVGALRDLIKVEAPDLVVDFWNPLAVLAARSLGLPVVTVIQADAHPASAGFVWWKTPPPNLPTAVPVVNRVLATHGLPAIDSLAELCLGDRTLVVGTPETDPLPRGIDVTYIGPALWQPEDAGLPGWSTELARDRPVVWVYSGNPRYGASDGALDSEVILHATVAALGGTATQVVLSTGHHPLPAGMPALPPNFRFAPYVPGLAMAARSDALIHHGGYGSCQTGLMTGKPAVILPTYSERESNARRIASLGAGLLVEVATRGRNKSVNIEALRDAVRRVLDEPQFAARARALGDRLRAYGGPAYAATIIEGACPRRHRTSTVRVVKSLVQASPPAPSGSSSVERSR